MSVYRKQGRTPPLEEPPVDVESIENQFLRSIRSHENFTNWLKVMSYTVAAMVIIGVLVAWLTHLDRVTKECANKGGTLLDNGQCVKVIP